MPTTEKARPGLVTPEYGPTGPELVRRRLGPRGRLIALAVAALVVLAVAVLIATGGDGLTELKHESPPQFTMLYAAGSVDRVKPGPGEIVRFRARRRGLRLLVAVRRLTLPPYEGSVSGLLPIVADRQAAALAQELPGFRLRTDGKARVNDAPGYQLRYRAGPDNARTTGIDILVVPDDGDREGVLLRFRQTNPARALGADDKALVKAARKAFRSFRFGLDRP
jgi:hypothetical protein